MHCSWFRSTDTRVIFEYDTLPGSTSIPVITEQFARIILNGCCERAANVWDREDTLTIPAMFNWLETGVTVGHHYESGVKPFIDHEFHMYLHYQHRINNESNLGWLQNMVYGVTQQIIR